MADEGSPQPLAVSLDSVDLSPDGGGSAGGSARRSTSMADRKRGGFDMLSFMKKSPKSKSKGTDSGGATPTDGSPVAASGLLSLSVGSSTAVTHADSPGVIQQLRQSGNLGGSSGPGGSPSPRQASALLGKWSKSPTQPASPSSSSSSLVVPPSAAASSGTPLSPRGGTTKKPRRASGDDERPQSSSEPPSHGEVREAAGFCATLSSRLLGVLYKNRVQRRVEVAAMLATCAHVAKVAEAFSREVEADQPTPWTTAEQLQQAFWVVSWPHLQRLRELLLLLDETCQAAFTVKESSSKRNMLSRLLAGSGTGSRHLNNQFDQIATQLRAECEKLERGNLQRQLNRVTEPAARLMGQLKRTKSHVLSDCDGREFWSSRFGELQILVDISDLIAALADEFGGSKLRIEDEATLRSILDQSNTLVVTQHTFGQFLAAFGPLPHMIDNVRRHSIDSQREGDNSTQPTLPLPR